MAFLESVPTVWDETRVLDARLADYVWCRRSGAEWVRRRDDDWTPRELDVDLSFLPAGAFRMEVWADGVNANRWGEDTRRTTTEVTSASSVRIRMAKAGAGCTHSPAPGVRNLPWIDESDWPRVSRSS